MYPIRRIRTSVVCPLAVSAGPCRREEVQAVMGVPEWFLFIDSRETKILHEGRCLQILVHFRGPEASKLEQVGRIDGR